MRFAAWEPDQVGVVGDGDALHPLPDGTDLLALLGAGLPALLEAGSRARDQAPTVSLAEVRLRAPLQPPTIRDFITFEQHIEGMGLRRNPTNPVTPQWYDAPAFYFSNPYAVVGPHDDVPVPPGCAVFDFELEVGAVIGPAGANLTPEEAEEHIAGYVVFNDWSARDIQFKEMPVGLGPAKGKDTATTLGPWLVTADELEPYRRDGRLHCGLSVSVNDVVVGTDSLANMAWRFADLVSYASRGTWVRPGDVLGSGTCGNGCLAELWNRRGTQNPEPLRVGDLVTMTVEGIGTIRNRVVAGGPLHAVPRATPRQPQPES
jgi:2-keto-4-pentenoate hydratase/2-oxohepta-3-ene-1,7-dioic acid hydratase in catechol pathway